MLVAALTVAFQLRVLTLAEAERMALSHQPRIRQAASESDAALARAAQARAAVLPQVRAEAFYERSTANYAGLPGSLPSSLSPSPSSNSPDTFDYFSFALSASQSLFDLGAWSRLGSARASAEAQLDAARGTRLQVEAQVATLYFAARARKELVEVAREALDNRKRHREQVEGFVEARTRPAIDLSQARAEEALAEVERVKAETDYRLAKAQLGLAMGLEARGDFDIADDTLPPVPGEAGPIAASLDEAERSRPDLAVAERRLEARRLSLRAQKAGYAPTLSLGASVSESGSELGAQGLAWNYGLSLTLVWTLFDGLRTPAQVREAEADVRASEAERDGARLGARYEIEQARLGVEAALATQGSCEVALTSARERLRLAEGRYQAGSGSALEVADAQLGMTRAAAQKVQAAFALSTARALLLQSLGRHLAPDAATAQR